MTMAISSSNGASSPINNALNFSDVQVDSAFSMANTVHQHPGNRIFARMVIKNRPLFQSFGTNHKQKKLLVLSMIIAIQKNGGRFLASKKKSSSGRSSGAAAAAAGDPCWVALSNREAFGLIIQALKQDGTKPLRPSILLNGKRGSILQSSSLPKSSAPSSSASSPSPSKKVTISC